jgi:hypothetical protein
VLSRPDFEIDFDNENSNWKDSNGPIESPSMVSSYDFIDENN